MNSTQAGRLLTLAYFLKTEVPRKQFCMKAYAGSDDPVSGEAAVETGCGTSACALGWCTSIWPDKFRLGEWHECRDFFSDGLQGWFAGITMDGAGVHYTDSGIQDFFGLTYEEADDLFGPEVEMTPKQKAKQIEKLVESHGYTYAEE